MAAFSLNSILSRFLQPILLPNASNSSERIRPWVIYLCPFVPASVRRSLFFFAPLSARIDHPPRQYPVIEALKTPSPNVSSSPSPVHSNNHPRRERPAAEEKLAPTEKLFLLASCFYATFERLPARKKRDVETL